MPISFFRRSVDLLFLDISGKILLQFRDSQAKTAPLTWSFFGGQVEDNDGSIFAAAAREAFEELQLPCLAKDFRVCGKRVGSDKKEAYLLKFVKPIHWSDICITEGSGAAFLTVEEIGSVKHSKAVAYFRKERPQVFAGLEDFEADLCLRN
jgi:8-oxo-dGTP pyrophosphatase MutT (NUDIX family)